MSNRMLLVVVVFFGIVISNTGCIPFRWERISVTERDFEKLTLPVEIKSEPPGAKVYVKDRYVGNTPITINFEYCKSSAWNVCYRQMARGHDERKEVMPGTRSFYRAVGKDIDDWIVQLNYKIVIYLDGYEKIEQELSIPEEGIDTCDGYKNCILPRNKWRRRGYPDYEFGFKTKYVFFLKATAPKINVNQQQQQQTVIVPAGDKTNKLGTINLTSIIDGCEIYVDGAYVGNTPATLKLSEGLHNIEVKAKGFKTWKRTIRVLVESTVNLKAEFEKEK